MTDYPTLSFREPIKRVSNLGFKKIHIFDLHMPMDVKQQSLTMVAKMFPTDYS
jgi:hypothetical protein